MSMLAMSLPAADAAPASLTRRIPAREEWVEAACKMLAYGSDVEQLASESLAEIIGVPEARLLQDFPEKNDFLAAVLERLLDEVTRAGDLATRDEPPSLFRMCRGIWTTLNAHLRRPAIPVLWRVLRQHPAAQALERRRTAAQLAAFQAEFEAIGVADAASYARTLNGMAMDIAEAENIGGQALPEQRRAICSYLRGLQPRTTAP